MNSDRDDRQFEEYLRRFQPRQPRSLPSRGRVVLLRWRGPMIAAVLGATLAVAFVFVRHKPPAPVVRIQTPQAAESGISEQISLGRLNALAKQDPAMLEKHLDQVSAKLLPDVSRGPGVLKTLSAE